MGKPFSLVDPFIAATRHWDDGAQINESRTELRSMSDEEKLHNLYFIRPYGRWTNHVYRGVFPFLATSDLSAYRDSMLNDLHAMKRQPALAWMQRNTIHDSEIMDYVQGDNFCSISDHTAIHLECFNRKSLESVLLSTISLLQCGGFEAIDVAYKSLQTKSPAVAQWVNRTITEFDSRDIKSWLNETFIIQHSGFASWMLNFWLTPIGSQRKALQLARLLTQYEFGYWSDSRDCDLSSQCPNDQLREYYSDKNTPYFYVIRLSDFPSVSSNFDERERILQLTLRRFDLLQAGESAATGLRRAVTKFPETADWFHSLVAE